MPVVQPYYSPDFDPGEPAIVGFWRAYLGERGSMNKALMQQRLSADPMERERAKQRIRDNITDLAKVRAEASVKGADWYRTFLTQLGQTSIADARIAADIRIAQIRGGVALEQTKMEQEEARAERLYPTDARSYDIIEEGAKKATEKTATAGASGADRYLESIEAARENEKVGRGDPKAKTLAYQAYTLAQRGDAQRGIQPDPTAAAAIKQRYFATEESPDAWMAAQSQMTDPAEWGAYVKKVTAGGGGGASARFIEGATKAGFAPTDVPRSGGAGFAYSGTTGGLVAGPGGGPPAVDTSALDKIIADYQAQLTGLNVAPGETSPFAGFRGNYLLETPFVQEDVRAVDLISRVAAMPPEQRGLLLGELRRTGGPIRAEASLREQGALASQTRAARVVADTGQGLFRWTGNTLTSILQRLANPDETIRAQAQVDLGRFESVWAMLPDELKQSLQGLDEAIAAAKTVDATGNISYDPAKAEKSLRRFVTTAATVSVEGDIDVGAWFADQTRVALDETDPERGFLAIRELASIAAGLPTDMVGDLGRQISDSYDDALRSGQGGLAVAGTREALASYDATVSGAARERAIEERDRPEEIMVRGKPVEAVATEETVSRMDALRGSFGTIDAQQREIAREAAALPTPLPEADKERLAARADALLTERANAEAELAYLTKPHDFASVWQYANSLRRRVEAEQKKGNMAEPATISRLTAEADALEKRIAGVAEREEAVRGDPRAHRPLRLSEMDLSTAVIPKPTPQVTPRPAVPEPGPWEPGGEVIEPTPKVSLPTEALSPEDLSVSKSIMDEARAKMSTAKTATERRATARAWSSAVTDYMFSGGVPGNPDEARRALLVEAERNEIEADVSDDPEAIDFKRRRAAEARAAAERLASFAPPRLEPIEDIPEPAVAGTR
jgi:hypothetical protein